MDFAFWWSFIGGGSAINGATPSSLLTISFGEMVLQEEDILGGLGAETQIFRLRLGTQILNPVINP